MVGTIPEQGLLCINPEAMREQARNRRSQGERKLANVAEGQISFAPFDAANVVRVEAGAFCQLLLGKRVLFP